MNSLFRRLLPAALLLAVAAPVRAQTGRLERATPESQGMSSAAVAAYFEQLLAWPSAELHSAMVVRHGRVVGEIYPAPFTARGAQTLYSVSKTFTAAAVGLAISENRLRLADRVAPYFTGQMPQTVTPALADMTVRDLLTMQSGIRPDGQLRTRTRAWTRTFLSAQVTAPGEHFAYDSMCSYILSCIVQKATGRKLLDYLREKIFTPLGITEAQWEESPEGYNTGGWGLRMQSESLAKFGQLLLEGGRWKGQQLLSEEWVGEMMRLQTTAEAGYGYQMWPCPESPGAARLDGSLGQYVFVVPEADMVVVLTQCCTSGLGPQRKLVWDLLLPACGNTPLPEGNALRALRKLESEARLPFPEGSSAGLTATQLHLSGREFTLPANDMKWKSLHLQFTSAGPTLHVRKTDGTSIIAPAGYHTWNETVTTALPPYSIAPLDRFKGIERRFTLAASYAWPEKNELEMRLHFTNWGSGVSLTFKVAEDGGVTLLLRENYAARTLRMTFRK